MALDSIRATTIERLEDPLRKIAVLFVTLAPLDVTLGTHGPRAIIYGLSFAAGGVILFMVALHIERRRHGG